MRSRRIGHVKVSAIGLGGMPLSIGGRPNRGRAIATIHAALDAGITLIDTADAYTIDSDGQGHNELLIAEALASYPGEASGILVATKGGLIHRDGDGPWERRGTAEYLRRAAEASRDRLGVESIGLYQFHRPDPEVDYALSMAALRDLLDDGVIRMAGISNVSVEQISIANEVLDGRLASVQNRFSPSFRSGEAELEYCAKHEIAYLPWSPLGGIGSGFGSSSVFSEVAFSEVADELGVSAQRVALAWELALEHVVIPIPGSTRPETITDSALAAELVLNADQLERLGAG